MLSSNKYYISIFDTWRILWPADGEVLTETARRRTTSAKNLEPALSAPDGVTHVTHFEPSTAMTLLDATGIFGVVPLAKRRIVYRQKTKESDDAMRQRIVRIAQRSGVELAVKSRMLDPLGIANLKVASREALFAIEQMLQVLTLYEAPGA